MKRIIILCAVAMVTGCGIYKPYSQPELELQTDTLYGVEHVTSDTTSLADLGWREIFTDPCLQGLIERGLENNSDLLAAHQRVKEAEAALKSARLSFLPSFNLSPNGGVSSFGGTSSGWTYSVPLAASWQIDLFGGINNAKRKAKATYMQSQEYRQAVRTQLIAGIANAYYTLLMLDSQFEVTRRTAQSLEKSAETMAAMMQAGMTNRAGVAQIEAAYYSVYTSTYDLTQSILEVQNTLCLLLGEIPHEIERGQLSEQQLPEMLATGLPVRLLALRPDVRAAEYSLMQAYYATAAARSALYPTLTLSGTLGWTNNAGSVVVNPGEILLSAAGSLVVPIFNGGRARAQLKIAKAQQEEARLAFRQALLNAGAEVNNALGKCQTARGKRSWREQQIAALVSAYESTQLLMQHGSTTYLEVLTAEQNLLQGKIAQITDRFEEIQGTINLYVSLGGGRDDAAYEQPKDKRAERKAVREARRMQKLREE